VTAEREIEIALTIIEDTMSAFCERQLACCCFVKTGDGRERSGKIEASVRHLKTYLAS
jgi:hypothetical protein